MRFDFGTKLSKRYVYIRYCLSYFVIVCLQSLVQYHQLRREDEFVGPTVEIEYWRRQLARFTSIAEFVETEVAINYIAYLTEKRDKNILRQWHKQLGEVYNTKNEAADNLKYLYALEKFWHFLYRVDVPYMSPMIPPLLHALRMTYTTSRYYNNTANITAILVKISNQLIIRCRSYINCNASRTVWNQPKVEVIDKMKVPLTILKY